jgi:hypothetical protein
MKRVLILISIALLLIATGCSQNSEMKKGEDQGQNSYKTPEEAFNSAKANLPMILNESQIRAFNLGSAEDMKKLVKTHELPLLYLPMDRLKDTIFQTKSDAMVYTLGDGTTPKICISTRNPDGKAWIVSTIGMKRYSDALAVNKDVTGIVEVLGLEISLLEVQSANGKMYTPVADYRAAGILTGNLYRAADLLPMLEAYRAELERKFGKDFSTGEVEM